MAANYRFITKPKRTLQAKLEDAALIAQRTLFALALIAVTAMLLNLIGVDPAGATVMALGVQYKFIDAKAGLSSSGLLGLNATKGQWVGGTVYAVGDTVINGGFLYRCSVAGAAAAAPGPSPNTLVDNAATWVRVGPVSGACIQDATQQHELSYQALVEDFQPVIGTAPYGIATLMYVKFTGTVLPGDWVIQDANGKTAVQIPGAAPGAFKFSKLGISMGSQLNGTFGWILIQGVHDQANCAAAGVVGTILAGSAVAGQATGAAQTANYLFDGTVTRAAGVVGTATVEIWWPTCSGR